MSVLLSQIFVIFVLGKNNGMQQKILQNAEKSLEGVKVQDPDSNKYFDCCSNSSANIFTKH